MLDQQQQQHELRIQSGGKLKRSISHRRKLAKKLPLIKKEIESNSIEAVEKLVKSIIECDLYAIRELLNTNFNVNARYNNWSLLHYACSTVDQVHCGTDAHLEMLSLLIDNGAFINAQDEDLWTPLHLACHFGVNRVIAYLIKRGANKEACTIENLRPIDLVEPDNFLALSFLMSSVNSNEKKL